MKKFWMVLVGVSLALSACEFQSYEDYEYPPYDGDLKWTRIVKKADWKARYGHAAVVFNGKIWVSGGYNPGIVSGDTYLEDVWSSSDGTSWTQELENAPWLGRRGHEMVAFDDGTGEAMFIIGGFTVNEESGYREYSNAVWKSTDGKEWIEVKPNIFPEWDNKENWFPRFNHNVVKATHDGVDYLYLIGGASMLQGKSARYAMHYFDDIWRSTDAVNWEELETNDFEMRSEAAAVVDPRTNTIYIQGGIHSVHFDSEAGASHPSEDYFWVWSSQDGKNWTASTDTTDFDTSFYGRSDHQMVYYNDACWVLPGKTTSTTHYHFTNGEHYPIWKIQPDGEFMIDSRGAEMDPRHGYASVVFNNKIWILGGFTSSRGQFNDVWTAE